LGSLWRGLMCSDRTKQRAERDREIEAELMKLTRTHKAVAAMIVVALAGVIVGSLTLHSTVEPKNQVMQQPPWERQTDVTGAAHVVRLCLCAVSYADAVSATGASVSDDDAAFKDLVWNRRAYPLRAGTAVTAEPEDASLI